jgi:antitoxin VapB
VKTAKIFRHGNRQAVDLPPEFRIKGEKVIVVKHGEGVLLLPARYTFDDLLGVLQKFQGPIERGEGLLPQGRKLPASKA